MAFLCKSHGEAVRSDTHGGGGDGRGGRRGKLAWSSWSGCGSPPPPPPPDRLLPHADGWARLMAIAALCLGVGGGTRQRRRRRRRSGGDEVCVCFCFWFLCKQPTRCGPRPIRVNSSFVRPKYSSDQAQRPEPACWA
uniref:Uncharacterized protein n=1 Tax=Oryza glaberrima TaxID=4538 RepID=I1QL53_ORYGL